MKNEKVFNLKDLITTETDIISGRKFGKDYADKIKLLDLVSDNTVIHFIIGEEVKAINDSFVKGLFNEIFVFYNYEEIKKLIKIEGRAHFLNLFEKNLRILDAIYHA